MHNVWEVWPSAFAADECDAIVARAAGLERRDATIGFADGAHGDRAYRSSSISWFDVGAERALVERLMRFVHSSNRTNFGFDIVAPFELQFAEYPAAKHGKYDWHHDVWLESPRPFARKLSIVVQLSDPADYEGGAFEFFGIEAPGEKFAARGSLLVFPSFLQHRVLPVTKGTRRSLVSWIEGPRWR